MKVSLYLRVSTDQQNLENQLRDLRRECDRQGHEIVAIYQEAESAWRAGHQSELAKAYRAARQGRFLVLWVWALDRLSRQGAASMLQIVSRFGKAGVKVFSLQESWTWQSGEMLELFLLVAGWAAQIESQRRSERTRAGLQRVKANGKPLGRPPGAKDKKKRKERRKKDRSTFLSEV